MKQIGTNKEPYEEGGYIMSRHTFKTQFLTIVTMLLVGIFLTGCTSTKTATVKSPDDTTAKPLETAPTPSAPVTPPDSTQQSVKLTLYFPNADASGLIATDRTVVVKDHEVIKTMFIELGTPPSGLENHSLWGRLYSARLLAQTAWQQLISPQTSKRTLAEALLVNK